ncbi:hypothetical protein K7X08_028966 [Anisodus acutangulus]|uniref:Uncharacterized protein n=1 Tax=Anisodus acutangulus TaxID=402998 RepID=A0A9Q1QTP7_9SOLA|nr:hypothetical protein K7X08_028966 [Anisodus acutangulus]
MTGGSPSTSRLLHHDVSCNTNSLPIVELTELSILNNLTTTLNLPFLSVFFFFFLPFPLHVSPQPLFQSLVTSPSSKVYLFSPIKHDFSNCFLNLMSWDSSFVPA